MAHVNTLKRNSKIVIASSQVSCLNHGQFSLPPEVLELFQAAISPHQILLSLLLALVVLYWLLVLFGALDFEADLPSDLGVDADAGANSSHGYTPGLSTGGAWLSAGRFLGFSQVPMVVWLSFIILFLWFGSLVLNEWYNQSGSPVQAALLILPNLLGSLILTKVATIPVAKLFKAMGDADSEAEGVIGRTGTVTSTEADETYGQLEIPTFGVPLLINVRTQPGVAALKRGDPAKVVSAGPDNAFYFIDSVLPTEPQTSQPALP